MWHMNCKSMKLLKGKGVYFKVYMNFETLNPIGSC